MDSPPRNDEWMPLATQQLRLRHLNRIIGLNIQCTDKCKLYFTLHHSVDLPPFYRSANIQPYGNSEAILWDTICSPEIRKSNARTVCVRVWEHGANEEKILFTWHVSFSGLALTGSCGDAKYFSNTLVFQLNSKCFSSPEHFSNFSLEDNDYLYENLQEYDQINIHDDHSGMRELTHSECSTASKSKYTTDSTDGRCFTVQRLKSATRQSYSLDKLLRIQKMQRNCKRLKQDLHEITEQIVNQDLRSKSISSKGRTIDYLLSDFDQTSPKAKLESKDLRKQIELLRFKCNLLDREREMSTLRNQELINQLDRDKDSRDNRCVALQENYDLLSDDKSILYQRIKIILSEVRTKKDLEAKIHKRLSLLCSELKYIYPINKNTRGCFTVSNIPFPDRDYFSSNPLHMDHVKLMTPAALSVTLGFVAHLVQITAIILDKPLRFPLQSKPSIPSKQILYGIYLLNQNIAQLNYDIFNLRLDPRSTIENFLKLFCSIIKVGNENNNGDVDDDRLDGEISILEDADRIEDYQQARSSIDSTSESQQPQQEQQQIERMPSIRKQYDAEDKRYHSEDDLKTLAERCLKHSYSHERLDKE